MNRAYTIIINIINSPVIYPCKKSGSGWHDISILLFRVSLEYTCPINNHLLSAASIRKVVCFVFPPIREQWRCDIWVRWYRRQTGNIYNTRTRTHTHTLSHTRIYITRLQDLSATISEMYTLSTTTMTIHVLASCVEAMDKLWIHTASDHLAVMGTRWNKN